jgi:general stress protein 26
MNIHPQQHEPMKKVAELVNGIDVSTLTAAANGRIISYAMPLMELDGRGYFWFFASHQAVSQVDLSFINFAFCDEQREINVSLTGRAELIRDQARIDELWTPSVESRFQHGKDDLDLVLLRFNTHTATYWDAKCDMMVKLPTPVVSEPSSRPAAAVSTARSDGAALRDAELS